MFFNKLRKRFVIALLCLENPGKFIVHSRSLYLLYAEPRKKLRPAHPVLPQIRFEISLISKRTPYEFGEGVRRAGGVRLVDMRISTSLWTEHLPPGTKRISS